jgi:hypothetical protein
MSRGLNDLPTTQQRQILRAAIRAYARELGYTEGMEPYEMKPRLRELLRGCQKLPIWENPDQEYKAIIPPSVQQHMPGE